MNYIQKLCEIDISLVSRFYLGGGKGCPGVYFEDLKPFDCITTETGLRDCGTCWQQEYKGEPIREAYKK